MNLHDIDFGTARIIIIIILFVIWWIGYALIMGSENRDHSHNYDAAALDKLVRRSRKMRGEMKELQIQAKKPRANDDGFFIDIEGEESGSIKDCTGQGEQQGTN